jgi:hypothetical protein
VVLGLNEFNFFYISLNLTDFRSSGVTNTKYLPILIFFGKWQVLTVTSLLIPSASFQKSLNNQNLFSPFPCFLTDKNEKGFFSKEFFTMNKEIFPYCQGKIFLPYP